MKGHILTALMFVAASGISFATEKNSKAFPPEGLKSIRIETELGAIAVLGVAKGDVQVEFLGISAEKCRLTSEVRGDTLLLLAERPKQSSRINCPAGFRVMAPAGLDLRATSGTGDIEVSSMSGTLRARSGTGGITLRLFSGELNAEVGSGKVKGDVSSRKIKVQTGNGPVELAGLRGSAKVQTGSGDMKLAWTELPASADVHLQAGSGDIDLAFPPRTKLNARFQTPPGAVSNEFADEEGGTKLFAQVGGGSKVRVRKAGK